MFADLLIAGFNVAFDHDAFYHVPDLRGVAAAVEHFFYDPDLLHILLSGVGVVAVHNAGRIFKFPFAVELVKQDQVFIVIVR